MARENQMVGFEHEGCRITPSVDLFPVAESPLSNEKNTYVVGYGWHEFFYEGTRARCQVTVTVPNPDKPAKKSK